MARSPFIRRKNNNTKNTDAMETFLLFNTLAPSTRARYEKTIEEFGSFLIVHNKSLWDADFEDVKKFLLEADNDAARSILKTFYRVLIDSGEFKSESPVVTYEKFLREREAEEADNRQPISKAESIIGELDDAKSSKQTRLAQTERRKIGKRIITLEDLDRLTQQASHIRDRAILEFLYATGAQIQETINLNLADVDLDARQVTIHDNTSDNYRILILPKRSVNFLKIYERWRRRQMSPSQAYFITKTTRRRMSDSSISTWLHRIQGDVTSHERWTAMDFRKRALLQHYWVTRDLTAVARFGGYKRPESALNLISDVLDDQGVDSIEALASLPEFEQLKSDKKVASVNDEMTITIQLDREEMDIIRNSGLTPTQAVKTVISLKDLYGAFGGGGGGGAPSGGGSNMKGAPSGSPNVKGAPTSGPNMKSPSGGPNLKAPTGGPNLKAPSGGPNLKAPTGGPNLKAPSGGGPNLKSAGPPGGSEITGVSLKKAPSDGPGGPPGGKPPGGGGRPAGAPPPGGGGGPMDQLSELKSILARRKKMADGEGDDKKDDTPGPASMGGRVEDPNDPNPKPDTSSDSKSDKDDDDDEDDIPEMPDFNL